MTEAPQPVDFDTRPPMPVNEYEQTIKRVNAGYDLLFTLALCFLRSLHRPALNLLVVGAGGGKEIAEFLPDNPGWRLTGVDPSHDMLAVAEAKAAHLGVQQRVTLFKGTVQDLGPAAPFDAAICMFVLHFLPDDQKLALLKEIAQRLAPGAPLFVATGAGFDDGGLRDDLLGGWREFMELMGMPPEQAAATVARLTGLPMTGEDDYVRLLREAGFTRIANVFSVLAIKGWLAR